MCACTSRTFAGDFNLVTQYDFSDKMVFTFQSIAGPGTDEMRMSGAAGIGLEYEGRVNQNIGYTLGGIWSFDHQVDSLTITNADGSGTISMRGRIWTSTVYGNFLYHLDNRYLIIGANYVMPQYVGDNIHSVPISLAGGTGFQIGIGTQIWPSVDIDLLYQMIKMDINTTSTLIRFSSTQITGVVFRLKYNL